MKKNCRGNLRSGRRASTLPLQRTLIALALLNAGLAHAQSAAGEPSVAQLTQPTNTVEIGAGAVSRASPKAGEYDGTGRQGVYGIGNIDLRGGAAYNENDATRWRLSGTNLGLETRDIRLEYGEQGRYRINIDYDELLRNGSAVYESIASPYLGAGGRSLSLPGNWAAPLYPTSAAMGSGNAYPAPGASMLGLAATGYGSPLVSNTNYLCKGTTHGCAPNASFLGAYTTGLPVTAANTAMLAQNQADLGDFHSIALSTKRQKEKYGFSYELSRAWSANVGMQREYKRGVKPLGLVNSSGGGYGAENAVILPELIDTLTDQYTADLNFKGESSFLTVAYFGEMFENKAPSMTVANPYGIGAYKGVTKTAYGDSSATISGEPNSTFNQFRLTGGYNFTPATRLVADAAYGRNGQNDSFVVDPGVFATPTGAAGAAINNGTVLPTNSANALVITKSFDLKLSAHPLRPLNVDVAYKYDDRDNRTPVNTYAWYDAGAKNFGAPGSVLNGATIPGIDSATPLYSGVNIVANRPYSKKINDISANADYAIARAHSVRGGLEWQSIDRNCNGTWIDCASADTSRETTERLEYRFRPGGDFSAHVGYDHGSRRVDYNPNAWMSLNPALAATGIPGLVANGYNGSVIGFLGANGLTPYGLPIAANAASGFTGSTLANYKRLFGTGNGGLSSSYYGNANITQNWPGLDYYNTANRTRQHVRGAFDWHASETFTVQTTGDYRHDNYPENVYGLKNTSSWSLNVDGDLALSDDLSVSGYYTHEEQRQTSTNDPASSGTVSSVGTAASATGTNYTTATGATGYNTNVVGNCAGDSAAGLPAGYTQFQLYNNNAKIAPCAGWQSEVRDRTDTLGLALRKKRLFIAQLSLAGDVSFSRALSANNVTGGFFYANPLAAYVANTASVSVPAASFINASALPDVVVSAVQLRLSSGYQLSKVSAVRVIYSFKHLSTSDYTYATTQPANNSGTVMPVMAQSPDYNVSAVGVSYVLTFQ
jgi:hypothetical protein